MQVFLPSSLSDHPSLVGIIRFPCETVDVDRETIEIPLIMQDENGDWVTMKQAVTMSKTLEGRSLNSRYITIQKSSVTDFYPYTYYVLTDGECEPLILQPQYMVPQTMIECNIALSHQPVERYYVNNYKGDEKGHNYNITNLNQMMLPTATNEGIGYMTANANTIMQNRKSQVTGNILNGVSGIASTVGAFASGNILGGLAFAGHTGANTINGINQIKNIDARNKDMQLTPNSISSFGTPSTRDKFNNNKVRLLKYTIKDNIKNKVNSFIDRYGNKFNNYDTINLRTYKGYIKFVSPDLDSKIDNNHLMKIKTILERGVYCE